MAVTGEMFFALLTTEFRMQLSIVTFLFGFRYKNLFTKLTMMQSMNNHLENYIFRKVDGQQQDLGLLQPAGRVQGGGWNNCLFQLRVD